MTTVGSSSPPGPAAGWAGQGPRAAQRRWPDPRGDGRGPRGRGRLRPRGRRRGRRRRPGRCAPGGTGRRGRARRRLGRGDGRVAAGRAGPPRGGRRRPRARHPRRPPRRHGRRRPPGPDRGGARGAAALARAAYGGVPGHPVAIGRDHWAGRHHTARGDRGARDHLGPPRTTSSSAATSRPAATSTPRARRLRRAGAASEHDSPPDRSPADDAHSAQTCGTRCVARTRVPLPDRHVVGMLAPWTRGRRSARRTT